MLAAPLCAQRTTVLVGPSALGMTCSVEHRMPVSQVPLVGGFLWSGPYPGGVTVPGLAVSGLLRVDPASFTLLGVGVSTGSPPPSMPVAVPNQVALLGVQLECQSFDLDATNTFQLASNDVLLSIVSGPPPGLNMVAIPPGTFQMGSVLTYTTAFPVHAVTISSPFWMGRDEVTQAQYQAVMGSNPSYFPGAQLPVEQVSWNSAVAYCDALTVQEAAAGRLPSGYEYRLPTEAEWEYCCRAGTTTEWNVGNSLSCGQVNFYDSGYCVGQTSVVGGYAANAWGLRDMHGNVFEWCLDGWDGATYYQAGAVTDPYVQIGPGRVIRGGSWGNYSFACRSAIRGFVDPSGANYSIGFRVVCAPVLP